MTGMDGDGIDEELTRAVGVAMLAAARAGEHFARMNQAAVAEREARAAGQTEQAKHQLDAHTEAARAYFEVTARPEYTGAATAEQLHEVGRAAEQWRERLPKAQRAEDAAATELTARASAATDLERAAVLASEADAADRSADTAEHGTNTIGEPDPLAGDGVLTARATLAGKDAVAMANTVQARPAWEAPAGGGDSVRQRRPRMTAPTRNRQTGVGR